MPTTPLPIDDFDEVEFPEELLSYGSSLGPEFNTTVVVAKSGREKRAQNWEDCRVTWDAASVINTMEQWNMLSAFFRNRKGKARGFRFRDLSDSECDHGPLGSGTGNGVLTQFQMGKIYEDHLYYTLRKIYKPHTSTVEVFVNGVKQTSGYTVNANTGIVTFTSPPSNGALLTWSGVFSIPARFDTDNLKGTVEDFDQVTCGSVPIVELKV